MTWKPNWKGSLASSGGPLRFDLHVHTEYSGDSSAPVKSVVEHCRSGGLGLVAITDHNNIDGALAVREAADFPVIIGEEIKSSQGDIVGLFLEKTVPGGMPPLDTARAVKDQGGLVGAPHPLDRVRPTALGRTALLELLPMLDFIEGYNAHTLFPVDNRRGADFANQHSLPIVACSDAHSALELGRTFTEAPAGEYDGTPQGLLRAIRLGTWTGRRPNPFLLMAPGYAKLRKALA